MTAATDAERIARRYPPTRTPRHLWVVAAVVLGVLIGGWTLWAGIAGANPPISTRIVGFTVTGDQTVDVTIRAQRPDPARPARCTLVAQAETYDTVGQLPIEIGPSTEKLQDLTYTVRTFKRATAVDIQNCVAA